MEPDTWRIIITDSEQPTGVAPICPRPDVHAMMHGGPPTDDQVYDDCCAGPHLECWNPRAAQGVLAALNSACAEVCS